MKKKILGISISIMLIILLVSLYIQINDLGFLNEQILSTENNKTQLYFIHWIDFPDEIFKAFEKEYPNIKINYERLDASSYSNLIRAILETGKDIDLLGIKSNDYSDFITRGYLERLTYKDYIKEFDQEVIDNVKSFIFNNQQYAISYNTCSYGIWYNKSIFQRNNIEIPNTYESFIEACYKLKAMGINPIIMGGRDEMSMRVVYLLSESFAFETINLQEDLYNRKVNWTDEHIIDALNKANYLMNKGFITKDSIYLTYQQAFQEFIKGSAAMTIMNSNSVNLAQKDFEQQAGEFGIFPLPINHSTDTTTNVTEYGNELLGISLQSIHKEEADLFIEFITRKNIVKKYMEYTKFPVPIRNTDITDIRYAKQWELLKNNMNVSVTIDFLDYRVEKKFDLLTKMLLIEEITVLEMAKELNDLQEQILKEDRKAYQ